MSKKNEVEKKHFIEYSERGRTKKTNTKRAKEGESERGSGKG